MKYIDCKNWSLQDLVKLIKNNEVSFTNQESRNRLAEYLDELDKSRETMYNIRVLIENPGCKVILPVK